MNRANHWYMFLKLFGPRNENNLNSNVMTSVLYDPLRPLLSKSLQVIIILLQSVFRVSNPWPLRSTPVESGPSWGRKKLGLPVNSGRIRSHSGMTSVESGLTTVESGPTSGPESSRIRYRFWDIRLYKGGFFRVTWPSETAVSRSEPLRWSQSAAVIGQNGVISIRMAGLRWSLDFLVLTIGWMDWTAVVIWTLCTMSRDEWLDCGGHWTPWCCIGRMAKHLADHLTPCCKVSRSMAGLRWSLDTLVFYRVEKAGLRSSLDTKLLLYRLNGWIAVVIGQNRVVAGLWLYCRGQRDVKS